VDRASASGAEGRRFESCRARQTPCPAVRSPPVLPRSSPRWTQADLAQALEVSRQTVNAIETGKYDPCLLLAFRLARPFERSIEEIFEDETED
jgi:putative transcriptional regulator